MKDEEIKARVLHEQWWTDGAAVTIASAIERVERAIALTREDCAKYHEACAEMNDRACGTQFQQAARWHRYQAAALRERGK